ncbi:hypothetical protein D3C78_1856170 [compost metagenome]
MLFRDDITRALLEGDAAANHDHFLVVLEGHDCIIVKHFLDLHLIHSNIQKSLQYIEKGRTLPFPR